MNYRMAFSLIFTFLIIVLTVCALWSFRSKKKIGKSLGLLLFSLLPPMIGNLIIMSSVYELSSIVGCYFYYLGMDLVMAALVNFTAEYCSGIGNGLQRPIILYIILSLDAVQLLLNPFTGHAFSVGAVDIQGNPYYKMIPYWGQIIHRVADYLVFFCIILMFVIATVKTTKIYREKYSVLLLSMLVIALWQTFYIFSRTPIDRSMVGYGFFGLIVFYFALFYRPLRLLDRLLSDIVSDMKEALYIYDPTGRCIWVNDKGRELIGLDNKELESVSARLQEKFGSREYTVKEWTDNIVLGKGNDAQYFAIENHCVGDSQKHDIGSYLVIRDNTEEQRSIQMELYDSTHDALTDLYIKQFFYECIREVLNEYEETVYGIVFVDVKNFKIVNDVFSPAFGDLALKQIAQWLTNNMTEDCLLGRLGGDIFGVFAPMEFLNESKDRIEKELLNFVVTDGNVEHRLLIHLGVYEITERDVDVSVMFDRAHLAISGISGNYKEHIAYYDDKLREKVLWDQQITASLTEAIEKMHIRPYLQPITDRSGKVVGCEALARWIHPEKGFLSPGMFIPVLEKSGLIVEADRHIWRCACQILAKWKKEKNDMFVSVNISPKDFYYIDIVSEIKGLVKEYDIDPVKLRVEITESVMITDAGEKFKKLEELRSAGFIVEMDDFGSGFSSLNLLKDMPVDVLKIDMKFLADSKNDARAQTIIRNIIKLSEDLDIVSLTEGVETGQQYSELSDMGCRLFQGYFFAKPLPQDYFEKFAEKQNSKTA